MRAPRLTLGRMMAIVAAIAAHAALLRAGFRADIELPLIVGPPILVLEVAAWRARRDLRPGRGFWLGYLLVGAIVTASLVVSLVPEATLVRLPNGTYGLVREPSRLELVWETVLGRVVRDARPLAWALPRPVRDVAEVAFVLLGVYATQIGPALLGGLVGRLLGRRRAGPAREACA
jgi:hypothetical protein